MLSSWFGLILVLVAVVEYCLRLATRRAPRSTHGYDGLVLFGMLIAGTAVTFHQAPPWRFFTALTMGIAWFAITRAELRFRGVSRAAREAQVVKVGDPLPSFSARTRSGQPFSQADLIAAAPAVLVLYRGHW